jgi:hypothetical protein
MGFKRLANPRFALVWIIVLAAAIALIIFQIRAAGESDMPEPTNDPNTPVNTDVNPVPERDRISPFKDGTGS